MYLVGCEIGVYSILVAEAQPRSHVAFEGREHVTNIVQSVRYSLKLSSAIAEDIRENLVQVG